MGSEHAARIAPGDAELASGAGARLSAATARCCAALALKTRRQQKSFAYNNTIACRCAGARVRLGWRMAAAALHPVTLSLPFSAGSGRADTAANVADQFFEWRTSVEDPAVFFQPSPALAEGCRSLLQALHAQLAAHLKRAANGASDAHGPSVPPQQLHVDGFDAEQIWAQLDMHVGRHLKRAGCAARGQQRITASRLACGGASSVRHRMCMPHRFVHDGANLRTSAGAP